MKNRTILLAPKSQVRIYNGHLLPIWFAVRVVVSWAGGDSDRRHVGETCGAKNIGTYGLLIFCPQVFCQSGLLSALSCDGREEIQIEKMRAKYGRPL